MKQHKKSRRWRCESPIPIHGGAEFLLSEGVPALSSLLKLVDFHSAEIRPAHVRVREL